MWGDSWSQRVRLTPLYLALLAADRATPSAAPPPRQRLPAWKEGVSIVIPDRDAPAMLENAVASLLEALRLVSDPYQLIVVANGAPADRYDDIRARYPQIEFVHSEVPQGFGGAIQSGMDRVRHDWTFLLNNDMTLDPRALVELLPLRGDDVFAVGSQIFQENAEGRREETGFCDWYTDSSGFQIYHAPLQDDREVRSHMCVSGGAGLFRTDLLRGYVRDARCYDPFYWEDVEWSVRALREGWRVLFCPLSKVHHLHRQTTSRYYAEAELNRIIERNWLLFDMRQRITDKDAQWLMARVCSLPYQSQREFAQLAQASGVLRQRSSARQRPLPSPLPALPGADGKTTILKPSFSYNLRIAQDSRPMRRRMMLITPFALFPPRHGGATRVVELLRVLRESYDIVLVTDEARLYDLRSFSYFDELYAVHLVQRDGDPKDVTPTLVERIRNHCHPRLVAAVAEAMRLYRPEIVQVEHLEVADLVQLKAMGQPWVLGLHDAYGPADFRDADEAERFRRDVLDTFDAVTVCSAEDGGMIAHRRVVCVPNGSPPALRSYRPSESTRLLFIGPFRYAPNLRGIVRFLAEAYPVIRSAVPGVTLRVLGGDDAKGIAAEYPEFRQPGVEVLGYRDDVPLLLEQCTLTINPLDGIRGSAIKLIESLTAGRICVSTTDGARGYLDAGLAGLITVPDVGAMVDPILALFADPAQRHRLEAPVPEKLAPYRWDQCAGVQKALYEELLRVPVDAMMAGNYDRIARFYDVDMARNMPFDDVAFYAGVCRRKDGRVLELGCGTGRILLPLLTQGIDGYGIDASGAMLQELLQRAQDRSLAARVCRMDLRALAFRRDFDTVLCPYSLVTYLTSDDDLDRALAGIRDCLNPDGLLVVDAFVPRPVAAHADFRLDYRRPFGEQVLVRWKRIAPLGPRINWIERRYQVLATDESVLEQIDIAEEIRPVDPDALRSLLALRGFVVDEAWWNYTQREEVPAAQFFTVVARAS